MTTLKKKAAFKFSKERFAAAVAVADFGLEPILGAAYLLTDRAYVCVSGDRKRRLTIEVTPKTASSAAGLKKLARAFEDELHTQVVRWAISKNNQPIQEHVALRAVALAQTPAPPTPAAPSGTSSEQLSPEQRAEIDRLIAEVEAEIKAMKTKEAATDPQGIARTWEEKNS